MVEEVVEVLVGAEALVVPAGGEDEAVVAEAVEEPGVREVGDVLRGGGVVEVGVVIAAEEAGHVEGAGHGEEPGEDVGVAEGEVCRVEAAEAAAEGDGAGVNLTPFCAGSTSDQTSSFCARMAETKRPIWSVGAPVRAGRAGADWVWTVCVAPLSICAPPMRMRGSMPSA